MKVYTKTGDQGQTSLLSKQRVFKDHIRVEAYGTVDEANAALGLAKSFVGKSWAISLIQQIQQELILLNADLATEIWSEGSHYRITPEHVVKLEGVIDSLETKRIPQKYFVTPGTCSASAALDLTRTMVRRAERCVVRLKRTEQVTEPVGLYLNRLSDLLFVLARCVEQEEIISVVTARVMSVLGADNNKKKFRERGMLEKAQKMIAAAQSKAIEMNVPMVIAVVDNGGNLVAEQRMDGALLASISLALDKAYTAVALKMPTSEAADLAIPGHPLFGVNSACGGRMIVFGGGYPLVADECIVGGLGVSGGSVEEDMMVAQAGLTAW